MNPSSPPSVNRLLFIAASGFTDPAERRAFLEFACHGDEVRLRKMETLLDVRSDAEEFFDLQPAVIPQPDQVDEGGLGARIGPYRIIDRLGSGGCGVVYLAEQLEPLKRKVALKIIRLGMDTENVIARFSAEREALALMDHPNIARVLDAGSTTSGRPYFAMELVDGEKITGFCDLRKLRPRQRLELFMRVCDAIQHAHQKGVIHRDIKPSNILVRDHEGDAVPKVIDFGIAKATAGRIDPAATNTRSGNFLGTPDYMSPEQAAGGLDIDTRSDIYSLGALLYELLTGHPPFGCGRFKDLGLEEIRSVLIEEEPPAPSVRLKSLQSAELEEIAAARSSEPQRLLARLAGDLDWIVMKAMEKDRRRRYETANALAMDVRRFLNEEAILARPPSRRYLIVKWIRRNRIAFAAGSVALSGLLGGLGLSTWLFLRERDAREQQARLRIDAERARSNEVRLLEATRAADLIAQAGVLLRYKEIEKADALVSQILPGLVPPSLEAINTLQTVAEWNLMQARWQAAAERYRVLVPVITSVDINDTDEMSRLLMPAAAAIKRWGRPGDYQQLRRLTLRRFADSTNPGVAGQAIKVSLLEPVDVQTLRSLAPLAAALESFLKSPPADAPLYLIPWRRFSLALYAYRQGDLDASLVHTRTGMAIETNFEPLIASNNLLLALIHHRQGRPEEARKAFDEGTRRVAVWEQAPFSLGVSVDLWFDWENARFLRDEALQLIGGP
jgi:eukaryotic-like serine/threonine-protein kinase